jgi:hypothetical protein
LSSSPYCLPSKPEEALLSLNTLITEGVALQGLKQLPPAKLRGDWQVMETTYSVVAREPFFEWRNRCWQSLETLYGFNSSEYIEFLDTCRFPWFLELLEGLRFLKGLKAEVETSLEG